jgi:uncharacterized protein (TIGR00299 family) protein
MILYIDPFAGIAGDMLCAALIDAGVAADDILAPLKTLPLDGYSVSTFTTTRGAFAATRFVVSKEDNTQHHSHSHSHSHSHDHSHDHDHGHGGVGPEPWPGQPDRRWSTIRQMLLDAALPDGARRRALAVFEVLARAEATVHGVGIEEVHFHEVGAVDSIVDIVAACVGLDLLGVEKIISGAPPLSAGEVRGAHGRIPLPAPATLVLLEGWPVRPGVPGREEVTPTGAAFLSALASPGEFPAMTVRATGCGAGKRDPADKANVLRVILGEARQADSAREVVVLRAQMDDLTGEHLPPLIEALLGAGAVDAYATAVLMKKGRSGLLVTALCPPSVCRGVEDAFLRHGSTFGVRRHRALRRVLDRHHRSVQTPWGEVRVKVGMSGEEVLHVSPEHDDVAAVARAAGVAVPRVYAAAVSAWHNAD